MMKVAFTQRSYTLTDRRSPLRPLLISFNSLHSQIHESVGMNTYIFKSIRARATKFDDNMSYHCRHNKFA